MQGRCRHDKAGGIDTSREVVSRLLKDMERKWKVKLSRNEILLILGERDVRTLRREEQGQKASAP